MASALTDAQVKALKKNYDFIIIRGQYGSEYVDKCLANNSALLDKYNMKFGVYSYSMYENADDARYEARTLHQRAPKADFTLMIMNNKRLNLVMKMLPLKLGLLK